MNYTAINLYDMDGNWLGYSIKQHGVDKLANTNIWSESPEDIEDLKAQLFRLNDSQTVLAHWPDVRDPEVTAILDDPTFKPLNLSPIEIVDDQNSVYAWIVPPSEENPYGQMDEERSHIVHKTIMVPSPTDVQQRVKDACEVVARRRAGVVD